MSNSAFTEIEAILSTYDLKNENERLKAEMNSLLKSNYGLRGANANLKKIASKNFCPECHKNSSDQVQNQITEL